MAGKNIHSPAELVETAQSFEVHLVACTMTMEVMRLRKEELPDGVEFGGAAHFINEANQSDVSMFIG
ncbi:MAG: DsrE/DsrF/DrsH-like family protein [Candidatus Aureabacteria bacterium]|nr:DsrE/DsrF/DrsH-like family protein [Candidatus Auribacterota bacterium]